MVDYVYAFEKFNIRIAIIEDEPWFVAKDICSILDVNVIDIETYT